ncbi:MAG: fused MFS/spermidine synthase [Hyphomicrobiaceae bacterium]
MMEAVRSPGSFAPGREHTLVLVGFTAMTFVSAFLLFAVQPMFTKMVLPRLGGAPSVWAVAMCFFQAALLAGYCYAHLLNRWLAPRNALVVHILVCLSAFLVLPFAIPAGWTEPPSGSAYVWQLQLFTIAVGLPFFAVAANAPLIQAWFGATEHRHAKDPYFLYAASNLGSLLALLGYPFLIEPRLGLLAQSRAWQLGFLVLVLMFAAALAYMHSRIGARRGAVAPDASISVSSGPRWKERLAWVWLALVPSALLVAFTTHVTTDVASAPLLWVIPLALYLLTFVLVFRDRPLIPQSVMLAIHLVSVIAALAFLAKLSHMSWPIMATVGVLAFLSTTMVAHRTLYERRPSVERLTEFYLLMSLGGVLGGLFSALIAPQIFSEVVEYPLLLALSVTCRPRALSREGSDGEARPILPVVIAIAGLVAGLAIGGRALYALAAPVIDGALLKKLDLDGEVAFMAIVILGLVAAMAWRFPFRQTLLVLLTLVVVSALPSGVHRGNAARSFFGVHRVYETPDGQHRLFTHGTTLHGAERITDRFGLPVLAASPGTYYHPLSPMASAVRIARAVPSAVGRKLKFGVVGLGTGSLACHSRPDETWKFYEIDPLVVDIARNPAKFSYVTRCRPEAEIIVGDARLTLAREPDASFDLLILDAFSSDAVPIHLLTTEALELYGRKIRPDGLIVLHISNRYLDLDAVVASTVKRVGVLKGVLVADQTGSDNYDAMGSTVAVLGREAGSLVPFRRMPGAGELNPGRQRPWTDDYSDIIRPFFSKWRE